jgi:hypothetical protein
VLLPDDHCFNNKNATQVVAEATEVVKSPNLECRSQLLIAGISSFSFPLSTVVDIPTRTLLRVRVDIVS